MQSLFFSTFNSVVPMFLVVFVGCALGRAGAIPESLARPLNQLCFRLLIPCLCINSMLSVRFEAEYLWLVLYVTATFLVSIPLLCRLVPKWVPIRGKAGSTIQGSFRSNAGTFAIPVVINVMGEQNAGPTLVMVALSAVLFNAASVIVLERFSETGAKGSVTLRGFLRDLFRNPIIIGVLIGLALRLAPFSVPTILRKPVADLAACATPMTMISIGLRLRLKRLIANRKPILLATSIKMIWMPLIWGALGAVIGFRGPVLAAIVLEHATPSANGCVPMAEAMGCDSELAGDIMLAQAAVAGFTIFLGVYLLRLLALI